jgi:hypothetical protein
LIGYFVANLVRVADYPAQVIVPDDFQADLACGLE